MPPPSVFVLGDSISIGYGPFLKQCLAGLFKYDRKSGEQEALLNLDEPQGANGGDSRTCLKYLEALRERGGLRADFLLLNCGLHDLKLSRETRSLQVPPDEFTRNLKKIVEVVRTLRVSGDTIPIASQLDHVPRSPRLIWVQITPVNYELHHKNKPFDRREEDVDRYNAAAAQVMREAGALICDLFSFQKNLNEGLSSDGVHYEEAAQRKQAAFIAGFLLGVWASR